MERNVQISILCQIYGKMLTEKQYNFLGDYYNNDLSLSEIAENNNITRQAVRDIIKQGENKLFEYEEKLKFMKRNIEIEKKINEIVIDLNVVEEKNKDETIKESIRNIISKVKSLN